jgi:anaerobic ribonucleoside-triphosphate reductase activating protein
MKLRLAGTEPESVVDGPGIRFVVFTQGCPHHCPGCHNPETWDPEAGEPVEVRELLDRIKEGKLLKGVTVSGGEPFLQAEALVELARGVRDLGLDLVVYTGFAFEELRELARSRPAYRDLLILTSILVDGPYLEAERDLALAFRGSRNQRLIDMPRSLAEGTAVEWTPRV